MAISEERLQLLLPKKLKVSLQEKARRMGISIGEYVRRAVEKGLNESPPGHSGVSFPFGQTPIHTGRRHGSTDHNRPD
jgi:hypothetical protein